MAGLFDFEKLLNTPCDKLLYARQTGRKNIKDLDDDLQCILLCSRFVSILNSFLGSYMREKLINVGAF